MTENNKNEHGVTRRSGLGISLRDGFTYLLIGGGIGAVIALLFAPKSGSDFRGDIADVTRKGYDATLEKANNLKARSADIIESVKETAAAVYDFASAEVDTGSETLSDVVSATTGTVDDGIDRMQNESENSSKRAAKA